MSRKTLISMIAILTLIVAGVFAVSAQDDSDDATPFPFGGPGMMGGRGGHGPGMMGSFGNAEGFGFGMMWTDGQSMMVTLADTLDLDFDAFVMALQDGQTLEEIAEAQGVELDTIYDTIIAQSSLHMGQMIEAGVITAEQAAEHLAWMSENIAEMPMLAGGGCIGGQFGFGMHGRGRGMWGN